MSGPIRLGSRTIDRIASPYVIAEIGVNHEGSIERAKMLIDEAKSAGANAAKFQTYKADRLVIKDSPAYWDTNLEPTATQFELFRKLDVFGERDYEELADYCDRVGIDFLSTPFDLEAVDFLDDLVKFFKIASADLTNVPLLRRVASKNKPVVLSTGASTMLEITSAVDCLRSHGASSVVLLHCILSYPTPRSEANLRLIKLLKSKFPDLVIGYSDHTLPEGNLDALVAAWLLGAEVLEKHFTDDKTRPGNDHYHAMDRTDLINFRQVTNNLAPLLGTLEERIVLDIEQIPRIQARRSLVASRRLTAGMKVSADDLIAKRPGNGIGPEHHDEIVGRVLRINVEADHQFEPEDFLPS